MHDDFHDQMAAFDRRRGRMTMFDPTKIEGNPGTAPPPPTEPAEPPAVVPAFESYGDPLEVPLAAPASPAAPSPLVEAGVRALERSVLPPGAGVMIGPPPPEPKEEVLWILDSKARLRGLEVALSPDALKKIETIVVREARNEMDARYKALTGVKARAPKKKRKGSPTRPADA